jgi:glycerophosphoryl diester phosphodiesterase
MEPFVQKAQILRAAFRAIRLRWRQVLLTGIAYKLLAFVLLTPIVSLAFRWFVDSSGRQVLADQDILFFFVSPVGGICLITVGGLWLAIAALEQAALLNVLSDRESEGLTRMPEAIGFALSQSPRVFVLTLRLVAHALLIASPFLIAAVAVYLLLLNEYDINYYLSARPPAFLLAVGFGCLLAIGLVAVLLRVFSGWLFALPVLLFTNRRVSQSLHRSRELADGQRLRLVVWLAGWGVATLLISALVSSAAGLLGQLLVHNITSSIAWLLVVVGLMLTVWTFLSFVINLASTTAFASILLTLYVGSRPDHDDLDIAARAADRTAIFQLTWRRMFVFALLGFAVSLAVGVGTIGTIRLEDETKITAHRGASGSAPDNTMASIRAAIAAGADWVEIDVQETADGEVVVFHDSDFKKVAGNELKIWNATREDLQKLDVGTWFSKDFRDERVPTLEEVLMECKGKISVNIELKYYGHDVQLEKRVIELVEAHDLQREIVIMSLKHAAVEKVRKLRPSWTVGLLAAAAISDLTKVDADFLAVSAGMATNEFIDAAHRSEKQVHVWTVNDPVTMSIMIGRGADHLITDEPALTRSVLDQRAKMGVPERLLLGVAELFGLPTKFADQ